MRAAVRPMRSLLLLRKQGAFAFASAPCSLCCQETTSAVPSALFVPLVFRAPDESELSFFSTVTTFGTALDITMAELTIEALFPADAATAAAVRAAWG